MPFKRSLPPPPKLFPSLYIVLIGLGNHLSLRHILDNHPQILPNNFESGKKLLLLYQFKAISLSTVKVSSDTKVGRSVEYQDDIFRP